MKKTKNVLKAVIGSLLIMTLSITSFAVVNFEPVSTEKTKENGKTYITKTYKVEEKDDSIFKAGISKEFEDGGSKYSLDKIETEGGNLSISKMETQIKIVETDTNDKTEILKQLPLDISYEEEGYKGTLKLDANSIVTTKVSNGTYKKSYMVSEDVKFLNYSPNDLYEIPKLKAKNGINMKLLNVDWKIQTTEYVAGSQVPVLYSGVAHYAGIGTKTVTSQAKYSTSAEYKGELVKEDIQPIFYKIKFVEVTNSVGKVIISIFIGMALIGAILYYLLHKSVKIYNAQNNEYVLIDKRNINYANPIINLNNLVGKSMSNMYKIVLSRQLTKKLYGTKIKIALNSKTIQHLVSSYDKEYSFDIIL